MEITEELINNIMSEFSAFNSYMDWYVECGDFKGRNTIYEIATQEYQHADKLIRLYREIMPQEEFTNTLLKKHLNLMSERLQNR